MRAIAALSRYVKRCISFAFLRQRDTRVIALFVVFVIIGVFVLGTDVHAAEEESLILGALGTLMGWIISALGKLVILVTNILIRIAGFNEFVNARPVVIGWELVRDVVNMFFIVLLLISAFSTIVGYKAFHYKSVLPKLLLYAVLINFSKTLVGLMIDFSQVIMLTFVNAFSQAAAGNITSALKLTELTALNPEAMKNYEFELGDLIGASMLAIFMLGATLTLLVIMTVFLVVRIVGLWMILIMSPLAFFALALPEKAQKGFSSFSSDWWSKLTTFLVAGPVMAFFLWLTLAVTQGSNEPFGEVIGGAGKTDEVTNKVQFATKIGVASNLATYLVAFILMLEGVNFAVSSSQKASKGLGNFATRAAAGGGVAVHLARGAAKVGKYGAKKGAKGTGRLATTFTPGLVEKVGEFGLGVSARLGGVGGETSRKLATTRARKQKAASERLGAITKDLSPAQHWAFLKAGGGSVTEAGKAAKNKEMAMVAGSRGGQKHIKAEFLKTLEEQNPEMDGNRREVIAEAMANQEAANAISEGKKSAEKVGDDKTVEALNEKLEKNSSLQVDWERLGAIAAGRTEDHKGYLKKLKADSFKDSGSFLAHGTALGFVKDDGTFDEDNEAYNMIMNSGGNRATYMQSHMRAMNDDRLGTQLQIQAMFSGADKRDKSTRIKAQEARSFAGAGKDGMVQVVRLAEGVSPKKLTEEQAKVITKSRETRKQRDDNRKASLENLDTVSKAKGIDSTEAVNAQLQSITHGATLVQSSGFNPAVGEFKTTNHQKAFINVAGSTERNLSSNDDARQKSALDMIDGLDLKGLKSQQDGHNEARSAMLAGVAPDALRKGYEKAIKDGRDKTKRQIKNLLEMQRKEGKRIMSQLKISSGQNKKRALEMKEIKAIAKDPSQHAEIMKQLTAALGSKERAIETLRIAASANLIDTSEQFRGVRQAMDPRASRYARGGTSENNRT